MYYVVASRCFVGLNPHTLCRRGVNAFQTRLSSGEIIGQQIFKQSC